MADRFPSPFDALGPHPLAREAAERLMAELRAGRFADEFSRDGGKMFGVLVAEDDRGERVTLRAFSGMLGGRWHVDGFVPPMFDGDARGRLEPAGEAQVKALIARAEAFAASERRSRVLAAWAGVEREGAATSEELRARHAANKRTRHAARDRIAHDAHDALDATAHAAALHALDQQSRADKAERRRWEEAHARDRAALEPELRRVQRRERALERLRQWFCRALMRRIHETYRVPNALGAERSLRTLFPDREPPSGAGDCAAPKLLAAAYARGLRPLALAEFWWGRPPLSGGRVQGAYYPACQEKCGPVLPFMLQGLDVAPPRMFRVANPSGGAPLEVVFEDAWIVVVNKREGVLSVPGKDAHAPPSVLEQIHDRYPDARGPLLVHRLDLDTSGLLVAALDPQTHAALQRQFVRREVIKRYIAVVDGDVRGEGGVIDLAIRVDLHDRPRQIHDPVHGRRAVTEWSVVERDRERGRTRVAFRPITGRTHQLRVHAAHPLGLGTPIVGDRLYGSEGERLMLHAQTLGFTHPRIGERVVLEAREAF